MKAAWLIGIALALGGCDDSMTRQPKYGVYAPSSLWKDGASARPWAPGVVARGDAARQKAASAPPAMTAALLQRGRERYEIFCTPCHGSTGEGDGIVVERGFPAPPPFEAPRLRQASARRLFEAIGDGYGLMYPFAARIPPADRWAIVAYLRALQLAGAARMAMAPEAAEKLR